MTKIAKNTKKSPPEADAKSDGDAGAGPDRREGTQSSRKVQAQGEEETSSPGEGSKPLLSTPSSSTRLSDDPDFDPLDLGNSAEQSAQYEAEQAEEQAAGQPQWYHPDGLTQEDVDLLDTTLEALEYGVPRTVKLSTGPQTYMRLADLTRLEGAENSAGAELSERRDQRVWRQKADTVLKLVGPSTENGIDELASGLFAKAPHFGPFLQAMRESAQLSLMRGATYFHFRPMLLGSAPGAGKSTTVQFLAAAAGLPIITLDGSSMMTTSALTGGDAVFRTSRPSDIIEGLVRHEVGNPIVVFDEIDKLSDVTTGAREKPAEALLQFLEPGTAGRVREQYVQLDLDLRFLNWILLANDLEKVPTTVRDRCKVIQLPPLTPKDLAAMAEAEVRRRQLEPELVAALTRACARGQIRSLRKLHKALDAAEATLRRPQLH